MREEGDGMGIHSGGCPLARPSAGRCSASPLCLPSKGGNATLSDVGERATVARCLCSQGRRDSLRCVWFICVVPLVPCKSGAVGWVGTLAWPELEGTGGWGRRRRREHGETTRRSSSSAGGRSRLLCSCCLVRPKKQTSDRA